MSALVINLKGEINALLIMAIEITLAVKGKLEYNAHMAKAEGGWDILSLQL